MKRAAALRPLSREHLAALLAAQRLREATDAAGAAAGFLEFWREDGRRHFRVREREGAVEEEGLVLHSLQSLDGLERGLPIGVDIVRLRGRLEGRCAQNLRAFAFWELLQIGNEVVRLLGEPVAIRLAVIPASASEASAAARCNPATVSSVTMATRAPGRSAAMRCPSPAISSRPMTMS